AAHDARSTHLARHQGRVGSAASGRRQDTGRGRKSCHVGRAGIGPHQNHGVAVRSYPLRGTGIECVTSGRDATGSADPMGSHMSGLGKAIDRKRRTVETFEPSYRLVWTQEPFVYEIDREAQRGTRRAFGSTRLQNPKLTVFDGELYVLDITEVAFKS